MFTIHSRSLRRLSAHSAGVAQTRLMSTLDPVAVIFSQTLRLGSYSVGFAGLNAEDFEAWVSAAGKQLVKGPDVEQTQLGSPSFEFAVSGTEYCVVSV
jgi:hypothetical protein